MRDDVLRDIYDCICGMSSIADEQFREIEKLTGLSKNQALTIKSVSNTTSVTVSELAKSLRLNPATMVRILDHLEGLGLISRIRSTQDRRVVNVELTDSATGVSQALRRITRDSMANGFVDVDTARLKDMLDVMSKLTAMFEAARK